MTTSTARPWWWWPPLLNALKIVKKEPGQVKVVVCGVGAAGTAVIKMLQALGVKHIIGVDEHGTIYRGRPVGMDFMKTWVGEATNPQQIKGKMAPPPRMRMSSLVCRCPVPSPSAISSACLGTASSSPWPIPFPRYSRKKLSRTCG
jgi:glutamate dehydrogenase/leucine dehydrogenase